MLLAIALATAITAVTDGKHSSVKSKNQVITAKKTEMTQTKTADQQKNNLVTVTGSVPVSIGE